MNTRTAFLHAWVGNTVFAYVFGLGLVLPALAHGLTGRHGYGVSAPQVFVQSLAVCAFGLILGLAQNDALRRLSPGRSRRHGLGAFGLLPLPYWLGYVLFYAPFDILFLFAAIGTIQAVQLRRFVQAPGRWVWQSLLVSVSSATAGIGGSVLIYAAVARRMTGVEGDHLVWLSTGLAAALVSGVLGRFFLARQVPPSPSDASAAAPGLRNSFSVGWMDRQRGLDEG